MPSQNFDVIVIGSGAGGLTAAVALAISGMRVLVLEQHDRPGGWCHSFHREGFSYSPGVHYIGELGEGGLFRRILQGLGAAEDLEFCEINPTGTDHILVGDERIDIPGSRPRFIELLKQRFPEDRAGIDLYFERLMKVADEAIKVEKYLKGWRALQIPFRVPNLLLHGNRQLQRFLDQVTKNPLLQTYLSAQAGLYALPPSQTNLMLASTLMRHYGNGSYYPRGGGGSIPRALIRQLKRQGGSIRLCAEVEQILVQNGRARGVRLAGGEQIFAEHIISNGDPHMTLGRLIGPKNLSSKTWQRLTRTTYSVSCLCLFLATDLDLRSMGYDSGNYWYYARPDLEGIYSRMQREIPDTFEYCFLSIPTLKDPHMRSDGLHTLEAVTMVPYRPFERWAEQPQGRRDESYTAFKEEMTGRLLTNVERIIPGIRDHLIYQEMGTPLTNYHYCRSHRGAMYGTEKIRKQLANLAYPVRTEVPGLYMVGSSTLLHGVMGASITGLMAASEITGFGLTDLPKMEGGPELRVHPSCDSSAQVTG